MEKPPTLYSGGLFTSGFICEKLNVSLQKLKQVIHELRTWVSCCVYWN